MASASSASGVVAFFNSSEASAEYLQKMQTAIAKLPEPEPTNNDERDSEAKAKHKLLLSMVEGCMRNHSYIMPLFTTFREHEQKLKNASAVAANYDEKFGQIRPFGKIDETFAIGYLVTRTDLSAEEIGKAIKANPDALQELLEGDTQLPPTLKVFGPLQIMEVMRRFLAARSDEVGKPLALLKNAGLLGNGALNWKVGSYALEFDAEGRLSKVTFRNGDSVPAPEGDRVTKYYKLIKHLSDWRKPFPEIKLSLYFEPTKKRPYAMTKAYTARCKEYSGAVDNIYDKWLEGRKAVSTGSVTTTDVAEAKKAIDQGRKDNKRQQLANAREQGKQSLKMKKQRSSVDLK